MDARMELTDEELKKIRSKCQATGLRLFVGGAFQPLNYVKVLMQLGHEPFPLKRGKTFGFFGQSKEWLPNGFVYARHIYRENGFLSLYTGLGASLCSNTSGAVASIFTSIYFDRANKEWLEDLAIGNCKGTDDEAFKRMCKRAIRESVSKVVGSVAARPFQVVMIRQMAQYIGGEEHYVGVIGSLRTIYAEEGMKGFFKGLVPLIIAELATVWALHSVSLVIDRVFLKISEDSADEEGEEEDGVVDLGGLDESKTFKMIKKLLKVGLPFVVSNYTYPFNLCATVMAVNGCCLTAGQSPYIAAFGSWQDCWQYLDMTKQKTRGAKMIMRSYDGPITFVNGQKLANNKFKKV